LTTGRSVATPVSVWNVANALTVLRILLVPVFVWLLLAAGGHESGWRIAAAVTFVVAGMTDRLDGEIARSRGLVTDFGKIADPIADKALTGTALVGLSILDELSWWVTVVVLVREVGITLLRFVVIRHGVMPAGRGGKVKTAVQGLAVLLYLLPLSGIAHAIAVLVMACAVVLTVATGIDYLAQAYRMRSTSERTRSRAVARDAAARPEVGPEVGEVAAGQGGEG
jgi:CDP-diacylglycerol---glycerol-3-phosphate 3-phosphatidyltransferase